MSRRLEIVSHRILWSLLLLGALASLLKRWPAIRAAVGTPRIALTLVVTAALIALNWLVYIYAVVTGHVLEGSLGYFLNPLVNVLLGVFLLKERLSLFQKGAVLLAAAGVAVLAAGAGDALWISLTLAASFALYGFVRKVAPVDAIEGLAIESLFLAPLALGWMLWLQRDRPGPFPRRRHDRPAARSWAARSPRSLCCCSPRRRSGCAYSTLGFLQYVAPSLQFLLAVLVFGEPLTTAHIICFAAIWTALAIFVSEGIRNGRRRWPRSGRSPPIRCRLRS